METYTVRNLSFSYAGSKKNVLQDVSFTINEGDFTVIAGMSGGGKTTLLRHLKSCLTPHGTRSGEILFEGRRLQDVDMRIQSSRIGFVMQEPDRQIVTDMVWHELAFGLENTGCEPAEMRRRIAETVNFFGIEDWYSQGTATLSGGQKQILNLAAIMAMQPSILLLDEPTSRLDPLASANFLAALRRVNSELGTTIIMAEHHLEDVLELANRMMILDKTLAFAGKPQDAGSFLKKTDSELFNSMPVPMQVFSALDEYLDSAEKQQLTEKHASHEPLPVSIRSGRRRLREYIENAGERAGEMIGENAAGNTGGNAGELSGGSEAINKHDNPCKIAEGSAGKETGNRLVDLKSVFYRYDRKSPDIISDLSIQACEGEVLALIGGNGSGKSTLISIIAGLLKPYSGKVGVKSEPAVMPQDARQLFIKRRLVEDLQYVQTAGKGEFADSSYSLEKVVDLCRLKDLLKRHPSDLSSGECQRAAIAAMLLLNRKIILLDEPTKGLDFESREVFAAILGELKSKRAAVILVSHDMEFCAENADKCAFLFDGKITDVTGAREFFEGNDYYTTAAKRMTKRILPSIVTARELIEVCRRMNRK